MGAAIPAADPPSDSGDSQAAGLEKNPRHRGFTGHRRTARIDIAEC